MAMYHNLLALYAQLVDHKRQANVPHPETGMTVTEIVINDAVIMRYFQHRDPQRNYFVLFGVTRNRKGNATVYQTPALHQSLEEIFGATEAEVWTWWHRHSFHV